MHLKAFDMVWRAGLLHKLKAYGVVSPIPCIFESFLQERSWKVVLDGQTSPLISPMMSLFQSVFV